MCDSLLTSSGNRIERRFTRTREGFGRWRTAFLCILCLLVTFSGARAAPDNPGSDAGVTAQSQPEGPPVSRYAEVNLNLDYVLGYFTDTASILTSPLRWDGRDWLTAFAVAGATGGLVAADEELRRTFHSLRSDGTDEISEISNGFGELTYTLPALGGIYLAGEIFKAPRAKRVALLGAESLMITGLFTEVLKFTGGRKRPSDQNRATDWTGFKWPSSNNAFPSSHTSQAFALATVFSQEFGDDHPWVPPVVYGLAGLTGLGRLNLNYHWASDVFFGAALGYFTSRAIYRLHREEPAVTVLPRFDGNQRGLMVVVPF